MDFALSSFKVQRNLKVKIEAQARFLERIAEEYKNRPNIAKSSKPVSSMSLPSLCDESESNAKEFESDSDIDKNEIRSHEKFRAPKRLWVEDQGFQQRHTKFASTGSQSFTQQQQEQQHLLIPRASKISYQSPESFQWSTATYCQSPLMPASYGSFNK